MNGILEDEKLLNDNPLEGDKNIFLTGIVITKDDADRFIEHHKEYSRLRLKEPIKVDIYL